MPIRNRGTARVAQLNRELLVRLDQRVPADPDEELLARLSRAEAERPTRRLIVTRSEEHTSELQSPCNLVCRLLLEKKKDNTQLKSSCKLACPVLPKSEKRTPPDTRGSVKC